MALPDGLDIVLAATGLGFDDLETDLDVGLTRAAVTSNRLDQLEAQIERLRNGAADPRPTPPPAPRRSDPPTAESTSWEEVRRHAASRLVERGLDPDTIDIDDLLDPAELAAIERRFSRTELRTNLDSYDLLFAALAGITATIVDSALVRIPRSLRHNGEWQQGSWLTGWLRDHAIGHDNWLAGIAKVPFDSMLADGTPIEGMSGRTHRFQTFGHDPLVGLVLGTLDIMRGTISGANRSGVFVHQTDFEPVGNPFRALTLEILHLLSDLPTRAGLPVPGWTMLSTARFGDIGGQRVDQLARQMYVRGYDTWHFMAMATVPSTVQMILRAYWGIRSELDPDFAASSPTTPDRLSEHPRFTALLLAGHATAAAGNIAKLVAYGGNPLALNYNQWLAFFRAAFNAASINISTSERLAAAASTTAARLAAGWTAIDAVSDRLPPLPAETARLPRSDVSW